MICRRTTIAAGITFVILFVVCLYILRSATSDGKALYFSGDEAFTHVEIQVSFGPRVLGSKAHALTRAYIQSYLDDQGWRVESQPENFHNSLTIHNIAAEKGDSGPILLIGAHYDSRLVSDRDPDPRKREDPVPGANDGASGVGVLLELARVIPDNIGKRVWLVFFDAEDNGNIEGYDWIMGSQRFADNLTIIPDYVVVVDMVGDRNLDLYLEKNSDPFLAGEIWKLGEDMGFSEFHATPKYRIIDDHIPFLELGIPSINIIDFDYPYWHTTADTLDKISPRSLEVVGQTLLTWIIR